MAEVDVARQRRNSQIFLVLLGVVTTACMIMASIWTVLVALATMLMALMSAISAGGAVGPELVQWYHDIANASLVGGFALALAPWGVIGFCVPTLLGSWFWRVRKQRARSAHKSEWESDWTTEHGGRMNHGRSSGHHRPNSE